MIKKLRYTVLILILAKFSFYCSNGVTLSICNDSTAVFRDLRIIYTGGNVIIDELNPNDKRKFVINPTSESSIEIEFKDSKNKKYGSKIAIYLEKNYTGSLDIKIESLERLIWIYNVEISKTPSCNSRTKSEIIRESKIVLLE